MPELRKLSGREVVKALSKAGVQAETAEGFSSHLTKETPHGKIGCVVPTHHELKIGTIIGILEQAKLSKEDFVKLLE